MRIAILGNSHIGSLKRGADRLSAAENPHTLTFFGARGKLMRHLRAEGDCLIPTHEATESSIAHTSGGDRRIRVDAFDAFLLYGLDADPFFAPLDRFYSSAVMARAIADVAETTTLYRTLTTLRAITDKPVYLGHTPLRAAEPANLARETTAYERGIALLNETAFAPLRATMIPQPSETIVNGSRTLISFSKGSKRLAIGDERDDELHPEGDSSHMNDEFGALWLRRWFARIAV